MGNERPPTQMLPQGCRQRHHLNGYERNGEKHDDLKLVSSARRRSSRLLQRGPGDERQSEQLQSHVLPNPLRAPAEDQAKEQVRRSDGFPGPLSHRTDPD